MLLPMISKVMTVTVSASCRWLCSPICAGRLSMGSTRLKAAMAVRCMLRMPAPSNRLAQYLKS
ncbi:hypothetical protein D3C85_1881540 [compost metagenome]